MACARNTISLPLSPSKLETLIKIHIFFYEVIVSFCPRTHRVDGWRRPWPRGRHRQQRDTIFIFIFTLSLPFVHCFASTFASHFSISFMILLLLKKKFSSFFLFPLRFFFVCVLFYCCFLSWHRFRPVSLFRSIRRHVFRDFSKRICHFHSFVCGFLSARIEWFPSLRISLSLLLCPPPPLVYPGSVLSARSPFCLCAASCIVAASV